METEANGHSNDPSREQNVASPSSAAETYLNDELHVTGGSDKVAVLEAKSSSSGETATNPQLGLIICPQCGQRSLFWNRHDYIYRCVNPECKRSYTLEEYNKCEAEKLGDELQVAQEPAATSEKEVIDNNKEPDAVTEIQSSELKNEAVSEAQTVLAEQVSSNESIIAEPESVEQVPCDEPVSAASDETELSEVEQVPYYEPIIAADDGIEPSGAGQILEEVSVAAEQGELQRNKINDTSSILPTTEVEDEVSVGVKSGKRMNRHIAFLIIGILGIGIIMAGIFLGQKSGELNKLSSQLSESREALTASQAQLAMAQEDITGLSLQLTQAQQEIETLQAQINQLRPLTPSKPFVYSGELSGGEVISIPMELKQFERVEGSIAGGLGGLSVYIKDPSGSIAEDLGRVFRSNFVLTALNSGTYHMIIAGSTGLTSTYTVNFTIYSFK